MRSFYLAFPIRHTVCAELSWSHFRFLTRVENEQARQWYLEESINQSWSARALDRQISALYYERLLSSREKAPDDNPSIGLILCSQKSEAVAKYSVLADEKQLYAYKYLSFLPSEEELRIELERERMLLLNNEDK